MTRSYWVAVWSARLALVLVPGGACLFVLVAWTDSTTYLGVLTMYWIVTIVVVNVARFAATSIGVPVGFQLRRSRAAERMKRDFFRYDVLGLREHAHTDQTDQVGIRHVYQEPGGIGAGELAGTSPDAPVEVAQEDVLKDLRGAWEFTGQLTWEQTKPDWSAADPTRDPR